MRIMYTGMDGRTRVAQGNRIKFLEDGFQRTDKMNEREEGTNGPVLVVHTTRDKGGKRLVMEVPAGYDMNAAARQVLEQGWIDLTDCTVKTESFG